MTEPPIQSHKLENSMAVVQQLSSASDQSARSCLQTICVMSALQPALRLSSVIHALAPRLMMRTLLASQHVQLLNCSQKPRLVSEGRLCCFVK